MKTLPSLLAAALLGVAGFGAQAQQGVNLGSGLVDFTAWTLYGTASASNMTPGNGFTYSTLSLTQANTNDSAGAAFAPAALMMDLNQAFHFDFHFFIAGDGLRGDGLTFSLTPTPSFASNPGGSALGYEGLSNSVALAVDTFHFDGEPVSPSLQILQNGSVTPLAATETGLGDGIRNAWAQVWTTMDFAPSGLGDATGTLSGSITVYTDPDDATVFSVFTVSSFVDLSGLADGSPLDSPVPVYYGFTAANGLASDGHYIGSGAPVPEPATGLMLLAGLMSMGMLARRRAMQQR